MTNYANVVSIHLSSSDITLDFIYKSPEGQSELKSRVILTLEVGKQLREVLSTAFPGMVVTTAN